MDIAYRRTPLPWPVRLSGFATLLIWMLVIASPFVAFTVNGRVDGSNWTPAFITMGVAVLIYAGKTAWVYSAWRDLPDAVREEYRNGRLIPGQANARSPRQDLPFGVLRGAPIEAGLTPSGVWFGPSAIGSASPQMGREFSEQGRRHELAWAELAEWQVFDEMDGDDYYEVLRKDGGWVRLMRPVEPQTERRILDEVRRAGCPVRLFCDVE